MKYLSWIGAAYLCWMAWHTLKSAGIGSGESSERSEGAGEQSDNGEAADEAAAAKNCNFMTGLLVNLTNVKVIDLTGKGLTAVAEKQTIMVFATTNDETVKTDGTNKTIVIFITAVAE